MSKSKFGKDFLYQKYITEQKSCLQIGREVGCTSATIWYYLKRAGIPLRGHVKKVELAGQRFGRLMVLRDSKQRFGRGHFYWSCRCDCGNSTSVRSSALTGGHTRSCGCLRLEITKELGRARRGIRSSTYKHGDVSHIKGLAKLYCVWSHMRGRCKNVNHKAYRWYGGKGIKVCKEWQNSYLAFKAWALNSGYEEGLRIHRKDSNGNYKPENCKWITNSKRAIETINERVARSMPIRFTTV